jgi:antitoxin PrlF
LICACQSKEKSLLFDDRENWISEMNATLKATATLTSKGQVTLPKVVRQSLNLVVGSQVEFELAGDRAVMTRLDPIDHIDPDIQTMLINVQADIAMGKKLGLLEEPQSILGALLTFTARTADVKAKIVGDVSL